MLQNYIIKENVEKYTVFTKIYNSTISHFYLRVYYMMSYAENEGTFSETGVKINITDTLI